VFVCVDGTCGFTEKNNKRKELIVLLQMMVSVLYGVENRMPQGTPV